MAALPILSARNFSFALGGKLLLDRVSFDIVPGNRCAIIGPNGAGKSTLMKSFCRLLPSGQGELTLDGRPIKDYSQKELARRVAYVPQSGGRENPFPVREFVLMGRYPYLSPFSTVQHQDWEAVDQALEWTGMQEFAERRMDTLSGGEQQKVLIAAALAQGSRVLLLDEPCAYLDPHHQDQIHDLLESLHAKSGATLVEVTHDINRAGLWHDHVIGLRNGCVVFDGPAEGLMTRDVLRTIYAKEFRLAPHPQSGQIMALPEVRA
jgi:iron complex transport system ATP-binding protein